MRSTKKIREILSKFMDTQRKQEYRDKQNIEIELAKSMPQKTSLMIGRTEIPKWIGQEFDVWKKELENWNENDKSSNETKYCNVLESLKKNDKIRYFVVTILTEKAENDRKVGAILRVMAEKYERKMSEKCLN